MNRELHKGFTLLELMIVVVILSILAAIAYPSYRDQVLQARRVDGKSAVLEVAMAEERHYTKNKTYSGTLNDLSINSALKGGKSTEGYYTLSLTVSDDRSTFTITAAAAGTQADDTACKAMSINHKGEKKSSNGAAATSQCW